MLTDKLVGKTRCESHQDARRSRTDTMQMVESAYREREGGGWTEAYPGLAPSPSLRLFFHTDWLQFRFMHADVDRGRRKTGQSSADHPPPLLLPLAADASLPSVMLFFAPPFSVAMRCCRRKRELILLSANGTDAEARMISLSRCLNPYDRARRPVVATQLMLSCSTWREGSCA